MEIQIFNNIKGDNLRDLKAFLNSNDLQFDENIKQSICIYDKDIMIATASLDENVIKCVCVNEDYQGLALTNTLISEIIKLAAINNTYHLFVFTKPKNIDLFVDLGFYELARTADNALLENKKDAFANFLKNIPKFPSSSKISAIVANCNPLHLGHIYLIDNALQASDFLYLFILSEDKSLFSSSERFTIVMEFLKTHSQQHRICLVQSDNYIISNATFPDYFLKETYKRQANTELDLQLFIKIAKTLNITKRFVGEEVKDITTNFYNQQMKEFLPKANIEVIEIARKEIDNKAISASTVRKLLKDKDFIAIKKLVPEATFQIILNKFNHNKNNI